MGKKPSHLRRVESKIRTIEDVREIYAELDAQFGVDTSGIELRISSSGIKTLAYCDYKSNRPSCIAISQIVLDASEAAFRDVILHEYCHALVKLRYPEEHHGHDAVWKAVCGEVGCTPTRKSPHLELARASSRERRSQIKYWVSCTGCGHTWSYVRKTELVRCALSGEEYGECPYCGSSKYTAKTVPNP